MTLRPGEGVAQPLSKREGNSRASRPVMVAVVLDYIEGRMMVNRVFVNETGWWLWSSDSTGRLVLGEGSTRDWNE